LHNFLIIFFSSILVTVTLQSPENTEICNAHNRDRDVHHPTAVRNDIGLLCRVGR